MLPEVEKYLAATKEATRKYDVWTREIARDEPERPYNLEYGTDEYDAYREARREWSARYRAEQAEASEEHGTAIRRAWDQLYLTTSDPMLRWMVKNIGLSYQHYVDAVAEILPATRGELEDLANDHDWCTEFDDFLEQATEAGVVPPDNNTVDVGDLVDWLADRFDINEREIRRTVQSHVNKIVETVLETRNTPETDPVPASAT